MAPNELMAHLGSAAVLGLAESNGRPCGALVHGTGLASDDHGHCVCLCQHASMDSTDAFGVGHGVVGEQWLGMDALRKRKKLNLIGGVLALQQAKSHTQRALKTLQ